DHSSRRLDLLRRPGPAPAHADPGPSAGCRRGPRRSRRAHRRLGAQEHPGRSGQGRAERHLARTRVPSADDRRADRDVDQRGHPRLARRSRVGQGRRPADRRGAPRCRPDDRLRLVRLGRLHAQQRRHPPRGADPRRPERDGHQPLPRFIRGPPPRSPGVGQVARPRRHLEPRGGRLAGGTSLLRAGLRCRPDRPRGGSGGVVAGAAGGRAARGGGGLRPRERRTRAPRAPGRPRLGAGQSLHAPRRAAARGGGRRRDHHLPVASEHLRAVRRKRGARSGGLSAARLRRALARRDARSPRARPAL
ncbi:MAG: Ferredoxin, 2Fe-2S, partial [uncultured Solirubrobacteraceae bacterium]